MKSNYIGSMIIILYMFLKFI